MFGQRMCHSAIKCSLKSGVSQQSNAASLPLKKTQLPKHQTTTPLLQFAGERRDLFYSLDCLRNKELSELIGQNMITSSHDAALASSARFFSARSSSSFLFLSASIAASTIFTKYFSRVGSKRKRDLTCLVFAIASSNSSSISSSRANLVWHELFFFRTNERTRLRNVPL